MALYRAKHPQTRDRVVAREDHHLDPLAARVVEGQQFFDQRESHARLGGLIEPLQLQLHIGVVVRLLENPVFFFQVKQRTRGNRYNELSVQIGGHGAFCVAGGVGGASSLHHCP